jgi:flagellar biosynthesis protein
MNYQKFDFTQNPSQKKAIAIEYDPSKGGVPVIAAQGKGYIAQKIIELAEQNGIPMEEDASLVSNLIDLDLGEAVPPQLYAVIAEILLFLEEMEKNV